MLGRHFVSKQLRPAAAPVQHLISKRTQMSAAKTALDEMEKGEFKRTAAGFRNQIEAGGRFEPEAGRYHLYISYACPWACRTVAAMHMKGLQDVVGLSVTHPTWQRTRPDSESDKHTGWAFVKPGDAPLSSHTGQGSFPCDDACIPDSINGSKFVRDLYEKSNDTTGKYSVPVLWDKQEGVIVNNESSDILRMFNASFNNLAKNPELDLYPENLRAKIDEVNEWVYNSINNGVYRCGFATKQEPYEQAFNELFAALDRCEAMLGSSRYLVGNTLTEADVRLFMTLIRFDHVYVVYFKTNKRFIHQYPNLRAYTTDLFHTPGVAASVNLEHIKTHYFTSHPALNTYAIIPVGGERWWEDKAAAKARAQQFPDAKQVWDE